MEFLLKMASMDLVLSSICYHTVLPSLSGYNLIMLLVPRLVQKFSFSAKMSQILKRDIERAQRVQNNVMNQQYAI